MDATQVQDIGAGFAPPPARELRARAEAHGLGVMGELEILTLILSRSVGPRAGSLSVALLERFGCLPRIFCATFSELHPVAGKVAARDLRLLADLIRRILEFEVRKRPLLTCWSGVHAYLKATLAGRSRECFRVLFLDKANQLIADELMGEGTVDHAPVYPREVMRRALELAASACCLVHNHPTGNATPSAADIDMTRQVVAAGRAIGVAVHDHFLVAGDAVISFKGLGLM